MLAAAQSAAWSLLRYNRNTGLAPLTLQRGKARSRGSAPHRRGERERQPSTLPIDPPIGSPPACALNGVCWQRFLRQGEKAKPRAGARGRGVGANNLCRSELRSLQPSTGRGDGHRKPVKRVAASPSIDAQLLITALVWCLSNRHPVDRGGGGAHSWQAVGGPIEVLNQTLRICRSGWHGDCNLVGGANNHAVGG